MRLRPTRRCVLLHAAGIPVALLPALIDSGLWPLWAGYLAISLLITLADTLLALPRRWIRLEISTPALLYIGAGEAARIGLRVPPRTRSTPAELLLDLDDELEAQPPIRLVLSGEAEAAALVPLVPRRRGSVRVRALWLRWRGPLGLTERILRQGIDRDIDVVPNVRAVRSAALRFFSNREFLSGLKTERYIGDGSEFDSLREFQPGLDHRSIDWKASARHTKLLSREYRAERNHHVVLAFDTGHLMREAVGGIPKLDHGINAGLLLSYVCLRTGDRVGLFAFDSQVRAFIGPQSGVHTIHALQAASARFDYTVEETNFTLGLTDLSLRLRRRTLVVLLSDFEDTVTAELMLDNLQRISRRHLVLFVALRNPGVEKLAALAPRDPGALNRSVAARDLLAERQRVLKRLERLGILTLDTAPAALTAPLINRYLEIKRREML